LSEADRGWSPALVDSDAAGFVLAGGRSSRMGRDKALLEFCGELLIERAISTLRSAGLNASIVCGRTSLEKFAPVVADREPGHGPLGGVCAAMESMTARYGVFLSVDSPFVPPSLLVFLLHHAKITGRAVTIAAVSGFDQTFPAVLDRAALPYLRAEFYVGNGGCFRAFQATASQLGQPVSRVPIEFLAQSGQVQHPAALPAARWFLNLNTPSDLERAGALASRRIA
jgi:molybdopterin-guanine dinucleotide biosynthesis protein A